MANSRALLQVAVVLPIFLLLEASAAPGLGELFGPRPEGQAPGTNSGSRLPSPLDVPKRVFSAISGSFAKPDNKEATTAPAAAAPPARPHHHHHEQQQHPDVAPKASTAAPTTTAAKATPAATTTTTAAPTSSAPTASAQPTTVAPRASEGGNSSSSSDEEIRQCREKWVQVANSTVTDNLDILAVLLDNGGFPGQLDGKIKWERNATSEHPNRWTYFWGDSDYKTYIRIERGVIKSSKAAPAQGTTPDDISGEIWWSPEDFCGKLRHAKYTQDPELRASNQPKVCYINAVEESVICWSAPECVEPLEPGVTCPRGGVSGALMASLVG